MPRILPELSDCAFFLYRRDSVDKISGPWGTGFFVVRDDDKVPTLRHLYAIANWHVVIDTGACIIRINVDDTVEDIDTDHCQWEYDPNGDDLVVFDATERLGAFSHAAKITVIHEETFLRKEDISKFNIALGEDVFMVGLFAGHFGRTHNVPAARFGNLSMLANEGAPVCQGNDKLRPSYIIDMRSMGGFSGSPVFLWRTPTSELTAAIDARTGLHVFRGNYAQTITVSDYIFCKLLGIHCSQFEIEVEAKKSRLKSEKKNNVIKDGDTLVFPSSMTVVVPAWTISKMLNRHKFESIRKQRSEDFQEQRTPIILDKE